MEIHELTLDSNLYNWGSLLGTNGSQELLRQINQRSGAGSFFGSMADPFRTQFHNFMQTIVEPIRATGELLASTVDTLLKPDRFRPIDSLAQLKKGIPPCMREGIVYYEPIRQLLNEDRIDGFGIDPKMLLPDDPYKSLCENGHATSMDMDKNFNYVHEYNFTSADPDLTAEEIMDLDLTRQYIDQFFADEATEYYDFTDYPSLHG